MLLLSNAACNQEGAGELIHPYLGRIYVVCTEITVRENSRDGGLARFSLKFVETTDPTAPAPQVDATTQLLEAKASVLDKAKAQFSKAWAVVGYATFVADRAIEVTGSVLENVENAQKKVRGALSEVAELAFKVRKIRSNISRIVSAPDELAEEIDSTFSLLLTAFQGGDGGNEDATKILKGFFLTPTLIQAQIDAPALVSSQAQVAENAEAMDSFVRTVAVANQAEALADRDWESAQEAALERDATLDLIDSIMENADDETYIALQALRVAITRAVPAPGTTLAQEIELQVSRTTPSLLLAYENFGTIENEADLISRNGIEHPGFIPAGERLKALNG